MSAVLHRLPRLRASTRAFVFLLALAGVSAGSAQTDPRLVASVQLAQDGQGDSARAAVARLLASASPADSLYPEALYTMGLVSRSVEEMRRSYTRIVVEYPFSSWADEALLRLAMLDYAAGNPVSAVRQLERIHNDYPSSSLMPLAALWAARSYFDLKRPGDACRWLTWGLAGVGTDIELQNQLSFYNGRCSILAQQPPESTRIDSAASRAAAPGAIPPDKPAGGPRFSVQVAAVKTQAAADKIAGDLKRAGFDTHIAREAGLLKVRVGSYPDRTGAQTAAATIKAKVGGSPYVIQES